MALNPYDRTLILQRLDLIMQELRELRHIVESPQPVATGLTERLLGALGAESLEDYNYNLDWERFEDDELTA
jgi:hypothetical protein